MFCANCGKEFQPITNSKYCRECEKELKEEQRKKQRKYTRDRMRRLNLTSINIYKEDSKKLASIAKEKKTSIAEVIKEILK